MMNQQNTWADWSDAWERSRARRVRCVERRRPRAGGANARARANGARARGAYRNDLSEGERTTRRAAQRCSLHTEWRWHLNFDNGSGRSHASESMALWSVFSGSHFQGVFCSFSLRNTIEFCYYLAFMVNFSWPKNVFFGQRGCFYSLLGQFKQITVSDLFRGLKGLKNERGGTNMQHDLTYCRTCTLY